RSGIRRAVAMTGRLELMTSRICATCCGGCNPSTSPERVCWGADVHQPLLRGLDRLRAACEGCDLAARVEVLDDDGVACVGAERAVLVAAVLVGLDAGRLTV